MFTGIITDMGIVRSREERGDVRFVIGCGLDLSVTEIGASIACSGCCLSVVEKGDDWFAVDASAETLSKTTLGRWDEGTPINLEPSLRMGDELGGHLVSGHVDGLAELVSVKGVGGSHVLEIKAPDALAKYIAVKGSVTLDGVSLTVNSVDANTFNVNIIPHTWDVTTLGQRKAGEQLNIEIDMLARYIERMMNLGDQS